MYSNLSTRNSLRDVLAMVSLALVSVMTVSAQQQASPSGHLHIVPKRPRWVRTILPGPQGSATQPGPPGAQLLYYGGPVISNVRVVVVFWGPNVNTAVTGGITPFFGAVTNSVYYDVVSEYSTKGSPTADGAQSTNQILGRGTVDGPHTITPSICNTAPCTVYNDQIQSELQNQINAGHLPAITTDGKGIPNSLYMIYFPPKVSINDGTANNPDPKGNSCVDFCGYHGTGTLNSKELLYGVMPDFAPGSGCDVGCGKSSMFDNVTMISSHELLEGATDPGVGLAALNAPPLGWYDQTNGEVGDICNQDQVSSSSAAGYSIQLVWSNVQNACSDGPPKYQISAPATASPGAPFSVTVSPQDNVGTSLSNYHGTVHFSSSDMAAVLPPDGSGPTFQVILKTLGSQTISVEDTHTSAMIGSMTINVVSGQATKKRRGQLVLRFHLR
jgi:hypothetical protein